jgi:hypothetical protein
MGRRRRRRWGTVVGCSIVSIAIIAFGTYFMWVRHSGVPARITIQSCDKQSGSRASDLLINSAFGDSCVGTPGSAYQERYPGESYPEFWGVYRKDVGHDIDVHITRGTGQWYEAVNDAWMVPQIAIGVGGVLGVAAVIGIVRRLRPAPVAAEWTGQPWPGTDSY